MGRVSTDGLYNEQRKKNRAEQRRGEDLARRHGGEPEDFIDHGKGKEFDDSDLTDAGFRLNATYPYTDPNGADLYQVLRYEHSTVPGAKKFRMRRKGRDLRWHADAGPLKVPYNWPDLIARPDETIYYVEGEKDADRLKKEGRLATTLAGQGWSSEAAKAFEGRDVVIIPDADPAGKKNAEKAIMQLSNAARSVRIVELPGVKFTGDVSDWLDAGNTFDALRPLVETKRDPSAFAHHHPDGLIRLKCRIDRGSTDRTTSRSLSRRPFRREASANRRSLLRKRWRWLAGGRCSK